MRGWCDTGGESGAVISSWMLDGTREGASTSGDIFFDWRADWAVSVVEHLNYFSQFEQIKNFNLF